MRQKKMPDKRINECVNIIKCFFAEFFVQRDGQCFHGNKIAFEQRRITDDQPFNMLIFRIVFLFLLFLHRIIGSLFILYRFVVIPNVCRFLFYPNAFFSADYRSDINVVYLRRGLTNDNGELHPNGVNISGDKKKNIFEYVVFALDALPAINRVSALACLFAFANIGTKHFKTISAEVHKPYMLVYSKCSKCPGKTKKKKRRLARQKRKKNTPPRWTIFYVQENGHKYMSKNTSHMLFIFCRVYDAARSPDARFCGRFLVTFSASFSLARYRSHSRTLSVPCVCGGVCKRDVCVCERAFFANALKFILWARWTEYILCTGQRSSSP